MGRSPKGFSEEMENTYVQERANVLVKEFYTLAVESEGMTGSKALNFRKNGDIRKGIDGYRALAVREARALRDKYRNPDIPESEQNYQTCLTQITKLKREISKQIKNNLPDSAFAVKTKNIATGFNERLSDQFSEDTAKKNFEYRNRVQSRIENQASIQCNPWSYLETAEKLLRAVKENPDTTSVDWRDVSCALALVTGRRQSEIHSMGEFAVHSPYEISFKGQSKGKSRICIVDSEGFFIREAMKGEKGVPLKEVKFIVPTLVEASLVVSGIDFLESKDRRIHGDDEIELNERVNKRWNKPLGECLKANWCIVSDSEWQAVDTKDKMTYHKLRGIWFKIAIERYLGSDFEKGLDMASKLLGDADIKAIQPYRRVKIVTESNV